MNATPVASLDQIAGGAQVVVRDEEWLVRSVQQTPSDGLMVRCTGMSSLVRDTECERRSKAGARAGRKREHLGKLAVGPGGCFG